MNPFIKVNQFERLIANYFGSNYAIATDSCTHAIELCLRYDEVDFTVCPNKTYVSIPMTLNKLNICWKWEERYWKSHYFLGQTRIIDAAVLWKESSYIPNTLMCLSFQFKKHLAIGRGGIILTNNYDEYKTLKLMSYDGRDTSIAWSDQDITTMGYHYYMTPENAEYGIKKFHDVKDIEPKLITCENYPDLSSLSVFN